MIGPSSNFPVVFIFDARGGGGGGGRREKNRASAQQSRQRKKCHLETLEQRVDELEKVPRNDFIMIF